MPLLEFIGKNFGGNQAAFARHMGVPRQKIQEWIKNEWIVVNNQLYSPRREIPE